MSGIIGVVSRFSVIGGALLVAFWAYKEYQRRQEEQMRYEQPDARTTRPKSSTKKAPPQPGNICCICHDDLSVPLEILPCDHIFHRQCIKKWFENRMICPYCTTPVTGQNVDEYRRRLGINS